MAKSSALKQPAGKPRDADDSPATETVNLSLRLLECLPPNWFCLDLDV